MKVCKQCNESKSLQEFYKHKQMKDGYLNKCRECVKVSPKRRREQKLRQKYGITIEMYNQMLTDQNGVCAICFKPEVWVHITSDKIQCLAVDHDHKTGKIRGLLCKKCNLAIGNMEDDTTRLLSAVRYLNGF